MHVASPQHHRTPGRAVEILIENFVRQLRYLPASAYPIAVADELPRRLHTRALNLGPLASWRAWTDGIRFWFIAARLCKSYRARAGVLALEVLFFDPDGKPVAGGEWTLHANGRWILRRLVDPAELAGLHGAAARRMFH